MYHPHQDMHPFFSYFSRNSLLDMLEVYSKLTMSPQCPFPRIQILMFRRPLGNTEGLGSPLKTTLQAPRRLKVSVIKQTCHRSGEVICRLPSASSNLYSICIYTVTSHTMSFVCLFACFCFCFKKAWATWYSGPIWQSLLTVRILVLFPLSWLVENEGCGVVLDISWNSWAMPNPAGRKVNTLEGSFNLLDQGTVLCMSKWRHCLVITVRVTWVDQGEVGLSTGLWVWWGRQCKTFKN